jgi:cytochrome c5
MIFGEGCAIKKVIPGLGLISILFSFHIAGFANDESGNKDKQLYEAACTPCHSLAPIEKTRDGRAGWEDTVQKMVVIGSQLNAEEMELVINYLYQNYGPGQGDPMSTGVLPDDSPMQTDGTVTGENVALPVGEGKQLMQGLCTTCHDLGRIVATRRGQDGWRNYTIAMLRQNDIRITEVQQEALVSYLDLHFGKADAR